MSSRRRRRLTVAARYKYARCGSLVVSVVSGSGSSRVTLLFFFPRFVFFFLFFFFNHFSTRPSALSSRARDTVVRTGQQNGEKKKTKINKNCKIVSPRDSRGPVASGTRGKNAPKTNAETDCEPSTSTRNNSLNERYRRA